MAASSPSPGHVAVFTPGGTISRGDVSPIGTDGW